MEVFCRNLPPDLTERSFGNQMRPIMKKLSIKYYDCDKRKGKNLGNITFLRIEDAKKFLEHHGEVLLQSRPVSYFGRQRRFPPTRPRLTIMDKEVFCKESNKQPSEVTLKGIEHDVDKQQSRPEAAAEAPLAFAATQLRCGQYHFLEEKLTFVAEWQSSGNCSARFTKRSLIIELPGSLKDVQIRIPLQSIIELVWCPKGYVTVTLSSVPTFLESMSEEIYQRLSGETLAGIYGSKELDAAKSKSLRVEAIDASHVHVAPFCLVYNFQSMLSVANFHSQIKRLKGKDYFDVTELDIALQHAPAPGLGPFEDSFMGLTETLAQLNKTESLPFGHLFLLQALVHNGYLHPTTVSGLAEKLAQMFASAKNAGNENYEEPISIEAMKKLFEWIEYPSPNGDASQFEVNSIVEYLQESEFLNRQMVKILEDMHAPNKWFLDLQERELNRLRGITANAYNTATFIKSQSIAESIQLYKFIRQTDRMGIDYRMDPFLRAIVEAVVLKELRLLKHKARIPVSKGITLFGVMDETGYLKEGEVYVTFDTMQGRHSHPPSVGRVIVTRSPALHPGDIQFANNVIPPDDHPLLMHRNCIVFSQNGKRDLPSQLSGGDLDGDIFGVIWDTELVGHHALQTFDPAQYATVTPLELDRPLERSDMAEFFIDFMKTDHLGVIATRHMVLADMLEEGTNHGDCIRLAELHSRAVDFSKTGIAVELNELPIIKKWRPDFLAPGPSVHIHNRIEIEMDQNTLEVDGDDEDNENTPRYKYYRSEKLLGVLYRAVDEENIWHEDIHQSIPNGRSRQFWDDFIARIHGRIRDVGRIEWRHRAEEAQQLRYAYEEKISSVMIDFSEHPNKPLTELEVFVGFVMNKSGVQTRRQRDCSHKLKDEFERISAWIVRQMRNPAAPGGANEDTGGTGALELCLACLHIGCEKELRPVNSWTRSGSRDVESFKIVAVSALIRELNMLEGRGRMRNGRGGGFVGVRGGRTPRTLGERDIHQSDEQGGVLVEAEGLEEEEYSDGEIAEGDNLEVAVDLTAQRLEDELSISTPAGQYHFGGQPWSYRMPN
ncbi:RNA dependent RNA polymerase-domain-containing protein [Bombardia bombarda]|uniref:RNA-dependent RNA polymerase n=1 Tax=Bombardia bombarda TaxID=252184 RepID=A0AA39WGA6_9PEZI|nr:RNA dependent RNA polymerase-domain-containing protein [Bombardia bombarda]